MPMPGVPYQRTPFEFRELRDELEELWTYRFKSPHILLTDTPLIFVPKEDDNTRLCMIMCRQETTLKIQ